MKNYMRINPFIFRKTSLLIVLFVFSIFLEAQNKEILEFKSVEGLKGIPTNEVQQVYQDHNGFIWLGTRNGLCMYDGYGVKLYRSDVNNPSLLTNNNVYSIVCDSLSRLWIGTESGLNILDKKTGVITSLLLGSNRAVNAISSLFVTKRQEVLIGTDAGLGIYDEESKQVHFGTFNASTDLGTVSVKSMMEDSRGDLWIGTWSSGLYRYSFGENKLYRYPQMNTDNSAHVLFEDSQKNIWVGSWNSGLTLLINPYDLEQFSWKTYLCDSSNDRSLVDDRIYAIKEDTVNQTLWIGARKGLSLMDLNNVGSFYSFRPKNSEFSIPCDEVNSLFYDNFGNMWLGSIGGGVYLAEIEKTGFEYPRINFSNKNVTTQAIRSLYMDSQDNLWIGVGSLGLAVQEKGESVFKYSSDIPELKNLGDIGSIYSMEESEWDNSMWFGTFGGGLYCYRKGEPIRRYNAHNSKFMRDDNVYSIYNDQSNNLWIGTRSGIGLKTQGGEEFLLEDLIENIDLSFVNVQKMVEDKEGTLWVGTGAHGVIKIQGDFNSLKNLKLKSYLTDDKLTPLQFISDLYVDEENELWVGTRNGGLYAYDSSKDAFVDYGKRYNLYLDGISCVMGDELGNLWLTTNQGLICLTRKNGEKERETFLFTKEDGLVDNYFITRSGFYKDGILYFGGHKGYNKFRPSEIRLIKEPFKFYITDITIANKSLTSFPLHQREKITPFMPSFTEDLTISHANNNFTFEFASLTYRNPKRNKYAYKLENFDSEWRYTDANQRYATYNNLQSGKYTFLLKATNEHGVWSEYEKKVNIIVHPPFWLTWWAFTLYFFIAIGIAYFLFKQASNRLILRNRLRLRELEKKQSDELNHAKLQFFTNITHELLTPLTVISATVDELVLEEPQYKSSYDVMKSNLRRLMRLLRQILEFRKAESGNLKLKVSYGDIALFIRNGANSFYPLIKKQDLRFYIKTEPNVINGFFDVDKVDKILYNLLSNATKYNVPGGEVEVSLSYKEEDDNFVLLTVKDNGAGISKEKQKDLFKRFYEGEYREYNTVGTGIGLSLTKDLVELHRGEIWLESDVGKGTTFFVELPISRSSFKDVQIEEDVYIPTDSADEPSVVVEAGSTKEKSHFEYTLLVVEDNEDLLSLMVKLLGKEYNVITAVDGEKALDVLAKKEVDLIVSDVMMPVMDGLVLCKEVKSNLDYSHIPVILLTAKNTEQDRVQAYEVGADAYISKPFNLTVLYARIKNLLEGRERKIKDFKEQLIFDIKELNYTSVDEDFIEQAVACVNKHLSNSDFDQTLFSEEMGTSKSTLYRKLKSLTGLSTPAFINNIRLKAAARVLEEKGETIRISELAYTVGFNDPKYFSSCFKREFELTPSEYMEKFLLNRKNNVE